MDRARFFNAVRSHVNLTTQNVEGFEKVLDYAEKRRCHLNALAYVLATAYWETASTMWPVREAFWLSEDWRKRNLRYWPFYGRGLIQTTWEANYRTMGDVIGVDLVSNPDLLLEWDYSLPALFVGMERGLYTGKRIADYIDTIDEADAEDLREFTNARRIVNGTDKAATIGNLALAFEKALRTAGYEQPEPKPDEEYPPLRQGDSGVWVQELQTRLNGKGYTLTLDGKFGPGTLAALKDYQQRTFGEHGVVGKMTWAALLA